MSEYASANAQVSSVTFTISSPNQVGRFGNPQVHHVVCTNNYVHLWSILGEHIDRAPHIAMYVRNDDDTLTATMNMLDSMRDHLAQVRDQLRDEAQDDIEAEEYVSIIEDPRIELAEDLKYETERP